MFNKGNLRVLKVLAITVLCIILLGQIGERVLPEAGDMNLWLGYLIGAVLGGLFIYRDFGIKNPNNLK